MSMRKLLVQYVGSVLNLPELERDVKEIAIRDKDFQIIQRFVPERTCRNTNNPNTRNFICSKCGESYPKAELTECPNYCPTCGSKVVSE